MKLQTSYAAERDLSVAAEVCGEASDCSATCPSSLEWSTPVLVEVTMGILDKLFGSPRTTVAGQRAEATPELRLLLNGGGRFQVPVVGESRYLRSFEQIFGRRTADGVDEECEATLVLEDDNPVDDRAVRVEIGGQQVGYLSREHAREYRAWLQAHGHRTSRATCPALVRGGWDRGVDNTGEYGVSLDLPAGMTRRIPAPMPRSNRQLDEHGQPNQWFNLTRRIDRSVHELLGVTKGIVADGRVSTDEVELLRAWMTSNPEAASAWPGNVLADRIARIYADGHADEDEREELRHLLEDLVGGRTEDTGNPATRLPLDDPPPALRFNGAVYVFTGRFFSGTRQWCQNAVESRGGATSNSVTRQTNYLVVGAVGSRDWKHTSFGRKIQKAVEVRSDGRPLAIVAEDHWTTCL